MALDTRLNLSSFPILPPPLGTLLSLLPAVFTLLRSSLNRMPVESENIMFRVSWCFCAFCCDCTCNALDTLGDADKGLGLNLGSLKFGDGVLVFRKSFSLSRNIFSCFVMGMALFDCFKTTLKPDQYGRSSLNKMLRASSKTTMSLLDWLPWAMRTAALSSFCCVSWLTSICVCGSMDESK